MFLGFGFFDASKYNELEYRIDGHLYQYASRIIEECVYGRDGSFAWGNVGLPCGAREG